MAAKNDDPLKTKEEWLREEIRANRTAMFSLLQWGTTLLAAVTLTLYYIRRDVRQHLIEAKYMETGDLIPLLRWMVGSIFLGIIAFVVSFYMRRLVLRHVAYRRQLIEMEPSYSGITEDIPTGGRISRVHWLLFYVFPCFDMCVWFSFYVGRQLHVPIPW